MSKCGRTSSRFHRETRGVKVSGGQLVTSGTILTRQGGKWKAGHNVTGLMHLTASCDGEVYFSAKRGSYNKVVTYVHIKPVEKKIKTTAKKSE